MIAHMMPLIVFTLFAGAAAGGAFAAGCASLAASAGAKPVRARLADWQLSALWAVLLGIGLLGTLMHLGQPMRFLNGLSNPMSMISQEGYWSLGLGVLLVADAAIAWRLGSPSKALRALACCAAAGLMVVTGLAYFDSLGYPAWSSPLSIVLFVASDLLMGFALLAALSGSGEASGRGIGFLAAVSLAFACALGAYLAYLSRVGLGQGALGWASLALALAVAACCLVALRARGKGSPALLSVLAGCAVVSVCLERVLFFSLGAL